MQASIFHRGKSFGDSLQPPASAKRTKGKIFIGRPTRPTWLPLAEGGRGKGMLLENVASCMGYDRSHKSSRLLKKRRGKNKKEREKVGSFSINTWEAPRRSWDGSSAVPGCS